MDHALPVGRGVLVEHGSLLSHSAIVAREMGIPAIVSIEASAQWARTGDWLEMDGATGIVRRVEAAPRAIPVAEERPPGPAA
ncbi:MAG: PEP-utilizing enzyme [Opitutaceae bacterium]